MGFLFFILLLLLLLLFLVANYFATDRPNCWSPTLGFSNPKLVKQTLNPTLRLVAFCLFDCPTWCISDAEICLGIDQCMSCKSGNGSQGEMEGKKFNSTMLAVTQQLGWTAKCAEVVHGVPPWNFTTFSRMIEGRRWPWWARRRL